MSAKKALFIGIALVVVYVTAGEVLYDHRSENPLYRAGLRAGFAVYDKTAPHPSQPLDWYEARYLFTEADKKLRAGDARIAATLAERALRLAADMYPSGSEDILTYQLLLADSYYGGGRYRQAEALYGEIHSTAQGRPWAWSDDAVFGIEQAIRKCQEHERKEAALDTR